MSKQIRPLIAYKKANPEIFLKLWDLTTAVSKKGQENEFYFYYALNFSGIESRKVILHPAQINIIDCYKKTEKPTEEQLQEFIGKIKKATYHLTKYEYNPFFFTIEGEFTNKLTITEIGRLIMTGWYYDCQEYTKELSSYVLKAYNKKQTAGEVFNDLEIYEVIKHIRQNITYYYHNKEEAKYYLIEKLFNSELKELLPPPPDELKKHLEVLDFLGGIRKAQRRKGIDHWINEAEAQESYSCYLIELLEDLDVINYLDFKEWREVEKQKTKEYLEGINKKETEYKQSLLSPEILCIMGI